jgi:hypothetical protein
MGIPKPPSSGSSGTQKPESDGDQALEPYAPLSGLSLVQRFEGLAATKPRNLGGEVAANLIAGTFIQVTADLQLHRSQAAEAQARATQLQQEVGVANTRIAVLEERLAAHERTQATKSIAIFSGTVLLAVSIDLLKAEFVIPGIIIAALGTTLVLFGWITKLRGAQK